MVKRCGGAPLLSIQIDHGSARPVSIPLHVGVRDLIRPDAMPGPGLGFDAIRPPDIPQGVAVPGQVIERALQQQRAPAGVLEPAT